MHTQERKDFIEQFMSRRLEAAYPSREALAERLIREEPLTFYLGIDPTGTELHLGHTIPLIVLKDLALLGHRIILLIGDFTARIGDPTGKNSARVALSSEDIESNMATYVQQVEKILAPGTFQVSYNSEWLSSLTMEEVLRLTSMVTVQQMIQRDMFQERLKSEKPIFLNEFLYPLMQGYDSVALRTDGEVGGNDQTFNMLMGRELEKEILGIDKLVLATRLLVDGVSGRKMSKTEGPLISVNDSAQEIRRKVLAVDDGMIQTVLELCTTTTPKEIQEILKQGPREQKEALAAELIRMYHGEDAVLGATSAEDISQGGKLDRVLTAVGVANSLSEAHRLVEQGGVTLNGTRVERWDIEVVSGDELKVGKGKLLKVL